MTFAPDSGAMVICETPGELIVGPESTFEVQPNSLLASLKTRGTPSVESEIPLETRHD